MINAFYALLLVLLISSCSGGVYEDESFMEMRQLAMRENKKLWLMVAGGKNCVSCNYILSELAEDGVFRKYSDEYIFYKCNVIA